MNISSPFINRPIMTSLVMIAILLFGISAFRSLPVSDLPSIDYPTITVTASQPGGSPEYMANLVATPLENNFSAIPGLATMTSSNTVGNTLIVLNFDLNVDLNAKEVEVTQAINASLPLMPPLPNIPTYEKKNPSDTPIVFLTLTTTSQTIVELYEVGNNLLTQPLTMIDGVSDVTVYGEPFAVRVQADPMKLMSHQIDFNDLASALTNANPNLPSGVLKGTFTEKVINTFGMLSSGEAYDEVIIKQVNEVPLYVGDVAQGLSALEHRNPYFRYINAEENENVLVLAVSRLPNSNTIAISEAISKKLPELQKSIPSSMKLQIFYDKSIPIIDSVFDVELTLLIALFLVVGVIFLYLGKLVDTIIPSIVLPLALVATFILMYLIGFNLDNLSLLALILAIGFVVDDSIVVLENIVRHTELGKSSYTAALDGSKQISTTVLTMSLALSAVFIPLVWMPGILGRVFHEFSLTIIIAIYCSGFISLSLNPMLCSRYLQANSLAKKEPNFSDRMNRRLIRWYENLLIHSIRYKKTTVCIGIACCLLSILLLKTLKTDFIPTGNLSLMSGLYVCQQGSSKTNTIQHIEKVNDYLKDYPYQKGFLSFAGHPTNDQGAFYMRLADASERPSALNIATHLRKELSQIVGINTYLKPYPLLNLQVGSTTSVGQYQYTLVSTESEDLYRSAEMFTKQMHTIHGLTGINSDLKILNPQLNITIDRDRAGTYGITAQSIESTLQFAYGGGRLSTFTKGLSLYDLIIEAAPEYNLSTEDLDLLYIRSPTTQQMVPLTSVASWKEVVAPASINHIDSLPAVTISFNLSEEMALGPAIEKLDQLAKETLPNNVKGSIQGTGDVFLKTFDSLKWLVVIAIIVIYLLLGILYESFIHPITVLSGLPIAVLGGVITLWIFNIPLSLYSVVGLIVLIGLVQKNGIMMIDFALEYLEKPGESAHQAILEACKARFRPIIMTTSAAMVGALPIAIGYGTQGETNRPLGLVIFGGLLFSQLITLFVTPVVFLYMYDLQLWIKRKTTPNEPPVSHDE